LVFRARNREKVAAKIEMRETRIDFFGARIGYFAAVHAFFAAVFQPKH